MIEVHRFEPSRRAHFERLHSEANGAAQCRCVAWWVPTWDGWSDRSAVENQRLRAELLDRGEYDGYLLYVDGEPAAWAQVGPRDRLVKLRTSMSLAPDPAAWAVSCFFVAPSFRRRGLARLLLRHVLDDLRERGVSVVEAFPRAEAHDAEELWNGPARLFQEHGFVRVGESPPRILMRYAPIP